MFQVRGLFTSEEEGELLNRKMILPILLIGFVLAGCSPKSISKENDALESIEVTKNDPKEV